MSVGGTSKIINKMRAVCLNEFANNIYPHQATAPLLGIDRRAAGRRFRGRHRVTALCRGIRRQSEHLRTETHKVGRAQQRRVAAAGETAHARERSREGEIQNEKIGEKSSNGQMRI